MITLVNGDCCEIMADMQPDSVHTIVTDPPYGCAGRGVTFDSHKRVKEFRETWDSEFHVQWVKLAVPLLRPGGSFFAFVPFKESYALMIAAEAAGLEFKRPIFVRIKGSACYPQNRKNFASAIETVLFFRKPKGRSKEPITWMGGNTDSNDWTEGFTLDRKRIHPAQKSVSAFLRMIETTTNPGDLILDPFAGSCVSGIAAAISGRRWIGMESNLEIAVKGWVELSKEKGMEKEFKIWEFESSDYAPESEELSRLSGPPASPSAPCARSINSVKSSYDGNFQKHLSSQISDNLREGKGFTRSSPPASPARTSAPLVPEQGLKANVPVSGLRLNESSSDADPVGSYLRMFLRSACEELTGFSKVWKDSGTPAGRSWWALTTSEPRTAERESGLWPTPIARDWRSGRVSAKTHEKNSRPLSEQVGGLLSADWAEWLMGYPPGYTVMSEYELLGIPSSPSSPTSLPARSEAGRAE